MLKAALLRRLLAATVLFVTLGAIRRRTKEGISPSGVRWRVQRPAHSLGSKQKTGWAIYDVTSGRILLGEKEGWRTAVEFAKSIP